jgi:hypothetical protein
MTAIVSCPECDKKFKARDDVKGKKMRCPACAAVFIVEELKIDEGSRPPVPKPAAKAPAAAPAPAATAAPPPAPAPGPVFDDNEETDNPYGVGHLDIRPRCPNCANEMENEDANICLFCGYNTLTRAMGVTKKVVAHTHTDRFAHLMPGIAAAVGMLVIILGNVAFVIGLPAATPGSAFWSWFTNEAAKLWTTLMDLLFIWWLGQFAYKRLLLEPTPEEIEAD